MFLFQIKVNIQQLLQLFDQLNIKKSGIIIAAAFSSLIAFLTIIQFRLLFIFIRGVISQEFPYTNKIFALFYGGEISFIGNFIIFTSLLIITQICIGIVQFLDGKHNEQEISLLEINIRKKIFARFLQFNKSFYDNKNFPTIEQYLNWYVKSISIQVRNLQEIFHKTLMVVILSVILVWIDLRTTVLLLFLTSFLLLFHLSKNKSQKRIVRKYKEAQFNFARKVYETISNITLIQAQTQLHKEKEYFEQISLKEADIKRQLFQTQAKSKFINQLSTMIVLFIVAFFMGIQIQNGLQSSYGLAYLMVCYATIPMYLLLAEKLEQIYIENYCIKKVLQLFDKHSKKYVLHAGSKKFLELKKEITIKNFSFYYKERLILDNISCKIPANKTTLILGSTGSGKTTLLHVLLRLYNYKSKTIFLDEVDALDFTLKSYREKIAFVSQDTYLFDDSIKFNAEYGIKEIDQLTIEENLEKAQLTYLINEMSNGYHSMIGERGRCISGGEKQRISLLRAFLKNANIWLLDEPSSALDVATEKKIYKAIHASNHKKTIVISSHRLTTLSIADHVIIIENKKIIEKGCPKKLLKKSNSVLSKLIADQDILS